MLSSGDSDPPEVATDFSEERAPAPGRAWLVLDRTAVLVVGLVAGFAVGLSFNGHPGAPTAETGANVPATDKTPTSGSAPVATAGPILADPDARPELVQPVDPRVVKRVAADGRLRVGVFGDSFGVGVWDGIYRQLPKEDGFDVLRFGKEATGFTRYRSLDLEKRAKEQLAADPIDVAVICFGANDAFPFYADGHVQELMSDGWKKIIGDRIDHFVAAARSTGAFVYWVGLPVMRDADMDKNMRAMNAFYAARMKALGVPFIDTRPLSVDAEGKYNAYLPNPKTGEPQLMRTPDGLHMIGVGYQRITAGLVARIKAYDARVRHEAGRDRPAATVAAVAGKPAGAAR
ncbi:SGNH/GDSL hydrolase family protein [Flavisphingomonas formosensis]|uniref:SGNH/GDSL hydrolase family protein n=1 Tax=Flavisphingomonas formosensis TaxID=861534 RepID=UPI0012F72F1E|nr:GDSL-type esterase/lipase family protein [Sphingomonas formosensis]